MIDEKDNFISPGLFLPAAEKFNLMPSIDRWVINKYFQIYNDLYLDNTGRKLFNATINLSGATLNSNDAFDYITEQMEKYNINADQITFEITETIAVSNIENIINFIEKLQKIGFHFALDDFGSGFSSFNYLKHLPVDYLKIDGNFVKNMLNNSNDYSIVKSINHIAHEFGYKTIAEFVENEDILRGLKNINIDYAQGYFLDKPKPLE